MECLALGPTAAYGVYTWMYHDADSAWGHRKNVLNATAAWVGIGYAPLPGYGLYVAFYLRRGDHVPNPGSDHAAAADGPSYDHRAGEGPGDGRGAVEQRVCRHGRRHRQRGVLRRLAGRPGGGPEHVSTYTSVAATRTPSASATWTANLAVTDPKTLHAVAVDRSGNYVDRAGAASPTERRGPTDVAGDGGLKELPFDDTWPGRELGLGIDKLTVYPKQVIAGIQVRYRGGRVDPVRGVKDGAAGIEVDVANDPLVGVSGQWGWWFRRYLTALNFHLRSGRTITCSGTGEWVSNTHDFDLRVSNPTAQQVTGLFGTEMEVDGGLAHFLGTIGIEFR
jgi:hypothetical protein